LDHFSSLEVVRKINRASGHNWRIVPIPARRPARRHPHPGQRLSDLSFRDAFVVIVNNRIFHQFIFLDHGGELIQCEKK
jgi:hypothetical protein